MRPEVSKQLSEILFDSLEVKDAIAYALYYGVNPDSKMCIPNCAYERAEKLFKEWRDSYREKSNEGQSIRVKNLESLNNKLEETNYNLNCNLNTITDLLEKAKEIIKFLINPQLLDKPQYYEWRLKAEQFLKE